MRVRYGRHFVRMHRWFWLLSAVVVLSPVRAWGDDERSEVERIRTAAEEFDAGRRAFTAGDFASAAEHFENADRDAPAPEALRMAIRARFAAKHFDRVATLATAALDRYPDDKSTVAFAKEMLAKVPKRLHRLTVTCDEPCTLLLDRRIAPTAESTSSVIYVEPGEHDIVAGWSEGRTKRRTVDAEAGGATELAFEAPPIPEKPPEPVPPPPKPKPVEPKEEEPKGLQPVYFYGALGITGVLTGVTVWSALDMRADPGKDKVREDCAGKDESCPTYQDALSSQKRTNVLLITTGVAAAGTAVLGAFFTDWSGAKDESGMERVGVTPTLGIGEGVFVGANGTF